MVLGSRAIFRLAGKKLVATRYCIFPDSSFFPSSRPCPQAKTGFCFLSLTDVVMRFEGQKMSIGAQTFPCMSSPTPRGGSSPARPRPFSRHSRETSSALRGLFCYSKRLPALVWQGSSISQSPPHHSTPSHFLHILLTLPLPPCSSPHPPLFPSFFPPIPPPPPPPPHPSLFTLSPPSHPGRAALCVAIKSR